jgi:carboxymethylenebutenolidase
MTMATDRRGAWTEIAGAEGTTFKSYVVPPRLGSGPALLVLAGGAPDDGILALCERMADEGYAVAAPDLSRHGASAAAVGATQSVRLALAPHLAAAAKTGVLAVGEGAALALRLAAGGTIDAAVVLDAPPSLDAAAVGAATCPVSLQAAGPETGLAALRPLLAERPRLRLHEYPASRPRFWDPAHHSFDRHAATMAHSRTLAALRPALGPYYDLARLFQEHLLHEFVTHDADATMATMVDAPYVNHVPTLTGGVGHDALKRFYKYHFIPKLPKNRKSTVISETVAADTIILEMVNEFTHDEEVDYFLPGVKPTGKRVIIPTVVVAKFRGDKLYHEHIYWDQASVLVQIGLLDPAGLPVTGAAEGRKMLDQSQPANELMASWSESESLPI